MPYYYKEGMQANSQSLRKNMTPDEKHLWHDFLKKVPLTVNRQKMIGRYIVDFYIHSAKLAIELDGVQHAMREHKSEDDERDRYLNENGITVLRIPNESIRTRFTEVCGLILEKLNLNFEDLKK